MPGSNFPCFANAERIDEELPLEVVLLFGGLELKSVNVNRRIVYHSIEKGGGYKSLALFCSIMNLPFKASLLSTCTDILDALELQAQEDIKAAGQRLRF